MLLSLNTKERGCCKELSAWIVHSMQALLAQEPDAVAHADTEVKVSAASICSCTRTSGYGKRRPVLICVHLADTWDEATAQVVLACCHRNHVSTAAHPACCLRYQVGAAAAPLANTDTESAQLLSQKTACSDAVSLSACFACS